MTAFFTQSFTFQPDDEGSAHLNIPVSILSMICSMQRVVAEFFKSDRSSHAEWIICSISSIESAIDLSFLSTAKVQFVLCCEDAAIAYLCPMPRTLAIDFGMKRTGLAISDPLGIIANGLDTLPTEHLMDGLRKLSLDRPFEVAVVGHPKRMSGEDSDVEQNILLFIESFQKVFPSVKIQRMDERFTSKIAMQTMIAAGSKRSDRKDKGNIDKISATLLLQEYLNKS